MVFDLETSIMILEKMPFIYRKLIDGLPREWVHVNEGKDTWSVYDIMGHLLHGEKTDWIPRMKIILGPDKVKLFDPYDRFAQFEESKGRSIEDLLLEFEQFRAHNMTLLKGMQLTKSDLEKTGIHPELGEVTLQQLIATWTIHDLSHLNQASRVLVKYYGQETGPWREYFNLLNS